MIINSKRLSLGVRKTVGVVGTPVMGAVLGNCGRDVDPCCQLKGRFAIALESSTY